MGSFFLSATAVTRDPPAPAPPAAECNGGYAPTREVVRIGRVYLAAATTYAGEAHAVSHNQGNIWPSGLSSAVLGDQRQYRARNVESVRQIWYTKNSERRLRFGLR
jgi:hypothetical protein